MGLLSPEARAQLRSGKIQAGNLVELDFSFGTERYWSGVHTLRHEGQDWTGVGSLGQVSPMESSQDLRANGIELSIVIPMDQGEPVPRFQNVKPHEYKNRSVRVMTAFFDEAFQRVIFSLERRYFMDVLIYDINPKTSAKIKLKAESELMAAGRRQAKRWTDEQQRDDYPGDLAFQFLSFLSSGVRAKWGTEGLFYQ